MRLLAGCLVLVLALALLILLLLQWGGPYVIEVVVTPTPSLPPTPIPDWGSCLAQGHGWYYCP